MLFPLFKYLLIFLSALVLTACDNSQLEPSRGGKVVLQVASQYAHLVDIKNLQKDVAWLADDARKGREAGTKHEDEVGIWLAKRFKKIGLRPYSKIGLDDFVDSFEIRFKHQEAKPLFGENIIGVIEGNQQADEYVIVSAHYDHLGVKGNKIYNGADDNATGVAALLETARIISNTNLHPKKSIVFIAFSGEEKNLQGSRHFCELINEKELADKMVNLNFEMFGAIKGQGRYLNIWNTGQTKSIVDAVYQASKQIKFPLLVTHAAGFKADARALQTCGVAATTMDVGGGAHFRDNHPHYHAASDNIEHIDLAGLQSATQVGVLAVWLLANEY